MDRNISPGPHTLRLPKPIQNAAVVSVELQGTPAVKRERQQYADWLTTSVARFNIIVEA